jgi:hypothetical protein
MGNGAPSLGVKRPGRESEHSLHLFTRLRSSSSVNFAATFSLMSYTGSRVLSCHLQGHICVVLGQNGKGNVKVKFTLEQATMADGSSRCIALLFL